MKNTGLLLSCLGFAGLLAATALEIGTGSGLLRAINYGIATGFLGSLIDHRTALVLVSGFAFVAGVVLYGFSVTEAALARMTAMIGEAIDAPDSYPAALPAPAKVELAALRSSAGMRMTATESPVELTAIREGGARGA
jgi:hypothetical protein